MSVSGALTAKRGTAALAVRAMRHPEWPVMVIAAAAWVPLVAHAPGGPAAHWTLMTFAMMLPVVAPRIRCVAQACEPAVRLRACATTLVGFIAVWMLAGVIVVVPAALLPTMTTANPLAFLALWWLAALWQLTPARTRAIERCHRVRMSRSNRVHQWLPGMRYGRWCVTACGPAMTAMLLTEAPPLVMAGLTIALIAERTSHRPQNALRLIAVAIMAWAIAALILAMMGAGATVHSVH